MIINVEHNKERAVVRLEGRLDTLTAPQFENEINALPSEVTDLVLDMEGLEYISSSGLRVLLATQKKMSKVGAMKVVSVCEAVAEVFEITGFLDILTIE